MEADPREADVLLNASRTQFTNGRDHLKGHTHNTQAGSALADWLRENPDHEDAYLAPMFANLNVHQMRMHDYSPVTSVGGRNYEPQGVPEHDDDEELAGRRGQVEHHVVALYPTGHFGIGVQRDDVYDRIPIEHHGVVTRDQLINMANHPTAPQSFREVVRRVGVNPDTEKPAVTQLKRFEDGDVAYARLRLARKTEAGKGTRTTTGKVQNGIVHPASNQTAAWAERSAVSRALQKEAQERGVPYGGRTGPSTAPGLDQHVEKYTNALRMLVQHPKIGKTPMAQAYAQAAARLSDPESEGKDATGREALTGTTTQPPLEGLVNLLRRKTAQGESLLGAADKLLTKRDPEHVPFENWKADAVRPKAEVVGGTASKPSSGFVELGAPQADPTTVKKNIDADLPAKIKPATDEKVEPPSAHYQSVRKVNRERDKSEAAPAPGADDEPPLPLADGPAGGKTDRTEGHTAAILRHAGQRIHPKEIARRVAEERGISEKTAAAHVRAWLKIRSMGLNGHTDHTVSKLARATPVQAHELVNGVYAPLAGTRLAKHLMDLHQQFSTPSVEGARLDQHLRGAQGETDPETAQRISRVARAILKRGPDANPAWGVNTGDPFVVLGNLLKQQGHPLSSKYNWAKMGETLRLDEQVKDFVKKHIANPGDLAEREYHGKVIDQYAQEADRVKSKNHDEFWKRVDKHFGKGMRDKVNDSLYRHYALADDRADFNKTAPTDPKAALKGVSGTFAGNKALRFNRNNPAHMLALKVILDASR